MPVGPARRAGGADGGQAGGPHRRQVRGGAGGAATAVGGIHFVAAGSNVEPLLNVPTALCLLAARVEVVAMSNWYRTAPVGPPGQPPFANAVLAVRSDLGAEGLRTLLREVERAAGRRRGPDRYAPRPIDLDVALAAGGAHDPDLLRRGFLAACLAEVAPDAVVAGTTVQALAQRADRAGMKEWPELTAAARAALRWPPAS